MTHFKLHEKAEKSFKDVDFSLITTEMLNKTNWTGNTAWHIAAMYRNLKEIPKELFTTESLTLKNRNGDTVLHVAAQWETIKDIPYYLLSEELFNLKDNHNISVWDVISRDSRIKDIPLNLINNTLLEMKDGKRNLFSSKSSAYIRKVISNRLELNTFIKANPNLEKAIEFRDSRLVLFEVKDNYVCFQFKSSKNQKIFLNTDGSVTLGEKLNSLHDAVLFIENKHPDIEKSLFLPNEENTKIQSFTL